MPSPETQSTSTDRGAGLTFRPAGLPGAEWRATGPAVDRADDADAELDEVQRFFTSAGLWEWLT